MHIFSDFDGGNIQCLNCEDPGEVTLRIRRDNQSSFYQWFYFKAVNVGDINCRYLIENASGAA